MPPENPFVSVVIPCFNEADNIGACIDSIRCQSYGGDYEIIAVDNKSTDDTIRIIKEKGVILEHAQKRGPATAKNKGIEVARGEIIVFLDADCIADTKWLKNMVTPFQVDRVGCVAGEITSFSPMTEIEKFLIWKKHLSQSANVSHRFLPYAATANAAYRKEVFSRVGLFDEEFFIGEDADMSWRMQLRTDYTLIYSSEAVVYHPHELTLKGLFRQKQRHADGAVALYKRYKMSWPRQKVSTKVKYWEYRSLVKRLLRFGFRYLFKRENLDRTDFNTIIEAGWKAGLIRGSLRYRIWYI